MHALTVFFRTNRMLEHVLSFPLHVSVTPQVKICFNHTQLGTKKFNKILLQSSKAFIRFWFKWSFNSKVSSTWTRWVRLSDSEVILILNYLFPETKWITTGDLMCFSVLCNINNHLKVYSMYIDKKSKRGHSPSCIYRRSSVQATVYVLNKFSNFSNVFRRDLDWKMIKWLIPSVCRIILRSCRNVQDTRSPNLSKALSDVNSWYSESVW